MNAGTWIALATIIVTVLGGGSLGVSKLTRIAVAVETLMKQIEAIVSQQAATALTVQNHENRLNKANL